MKNRKEKNDTIDAFLKGCNDLGLDEVAVFASNSSDRTQVITCLKSKGTPEAMAMIAMLIKILSDETEIPSPEIAEMIRKRLEYAERKIEEEEKGKKVIHIKITDLDD